MNLGTRIILVALAIGATSAGTASAKFNLKYETPVTDVSPAITSSISVFRDSFPVPIGFPVDQILMSKDGRTVGGFNINLARPAHDNLGRIALYEGNEDENWLIPGLRNNVMVVTINSGTGRNLVAGTADVSSANFQTFGSVFSGGWRKGHGPWNVTTVAFVPDSITSVTFTSKRRGKSALIQTFVPAANVVVVHGSNVVYVTINGKQFNVRWPTPRRKHHKH